MLNSVVIMGRFTAAPVLRYTQSNTPVASFTLAVDRDFSGKDGSEKQTDFIDCVAWRNTAEFISNYFDKGSQAVVRGQIQTRNYVDKDGNKRHVCEINVEKIYFSGEKNKKINQEVEEFLEKNSEKFDGSPFKNISDEDGDLPF